MKTKTQLIIGYEELIPFVKSLQKYKENVLTSPIAAGKWSPLAIISHLMLWDQYYIENAIHPIAAQPEITEISVSNDIDVEAFNQNAIKFAEQESRGEILKLTIETREQLLQELKRIPENHFGKAYLDRERSSFIIADFISDMIGHDKHHIAQIEDYLTSVQ